MEGYSHKGVSVLLKRRQGLPADVR